MSKILFSQRTEKSKLKIAYEMEQLQLFFKNKLDLNLYLIYGTLLGAIREKDFIPHDCDVDFAYISKKTTKYKVLQEFIFISNILKNNKILKKIKQNGQVHCKGLTDNFIFDIWTSYISENNFYLMPSDKIYDCKLIMPLKTICFKNKSFNIPNNSEKLLNELYTDWTKPIQDNYRNFNITKIL